jgi:hypothetical protein
LEQLKEEERLNKLIMENFKKIEVKDKKWKSVSYFWGWG